MINFSGAYSLSIRKISGELVRRLMFTNLITDSGLNRIATGNWIDRIVIGTGVTAPDSEDTVLEALFLSTTDKRNETTISSGSAPFKKRYLTTYRFAAGDLDEDIEYSEIGCGWGDTALFSRSLIKDHDGEPTTIKMLDDEYLDVVYELTITHQAVDVPFSFVSGGVTYSGVVRAANATSGSIDTTAAISLTTGAIYDGAIGLESEFPAGSTESATVATDAYIADSHEITGNVRGINSELTQISAISWTLGGIACSYQASITPPLLTPTTFTLRLNVSSTWGRE